MTKDAYDFGFLSPSEHCERMQRILSTPVPRGKEFEARLRALLLVKESRVQKMHDDATRAAAVRDTDAIRYALLGRVER